MISHSALYVPYKNSLRTLDVLIIEDKKRGERWWWDRYSGRTGKQALSSNPCSVDWIPRCRVFTLLCAICCLKVHDCHCTNNLQSQRGVQGGTWHPWHLIGHPWCHPKILISYNSFQSLFVTCTQYFINFKILRKMNVDCQIFFFYGLKKVYASFRDIIIYFSLSDCTVFTAKLIAALTFILEASFPVSWLDSVIRCWPVALNVRIWCCGLPSGLGFLNNFYESWVTV